jgi:hypothetical protein
MPLRLLPGRLALTALLATLPLCLHAAPASLGAAFAAGEQLALPGLRITVAPNFVGVTGVPPDTLIASANVPLTDLTGPTQMTIAGGEYFLNGRGSFTRPISLVPGDKLRLVIKAPSTFNTVGQITLKLGSRTFTFQVTTAALDPQVMVSKIFSGATPNVSVDPSGLVKITATPAAPLQLQGDATAGTVIDIPYNVPVPISVTMKGDVVTFRSISQDEPGRLVVRNAPFGARLGYFSGRFQLDALNADTTFPVNDDDKPALLRTTAPGSSLARPSSTARKTASAAISSAPALPGSNRTTAR